MKERNIIPRRHSVAFMIALYILPIVTLTSYAQIRLSPELLTRQQEYLLGSYGLYSRDGIHLILENEAQELLTVIIVVEGDGIEIDYNHNSVKMKSTSTRIHLGVSQTFLAANPYPNETFEIDPYIYDEQSIQSIFLFIGEYRYPKIEWKVAVENGEQIETGANTIIGNVIVAPQNDPNPPSAEELSLLSDPFSPNLDPFNIRFFITITRSRQ
jgi:hypothetical protein